MNFIETFLKLSESDREKLTETLLLLKNAGTKVPSSDSAGVSGTDLKDFLNLSNSKQEKNVSKQKTLDNWIVKTKSTQSDCENNVTRSKEIIPITETVEASKNLEPGEVCTLDGQIPCSSSSIVKSSDTENVNEKKLMVLLEKQDLLESINKSENSVFSSKNKLIIPTGIKSRKHTHIQENYCKKILSPEKHSPSPPRSYNLRSAKGVLDESSSSEATNSLTNSPEGENIVEIHSLVIQQKPKLKNSRGKDASPDSSVCSKKANYDQKNDSHNNACYKENAENSTGEILPVAVNSDLKEASTVAVKFIQKNKITISDGNPMLEGSNETLIVKGKRSRVSKGKESKKLCVSSAAQKNSSIQQTKAREEINVNNKSAQSISTSNIKGAKSNSAKENSSEPPFSKAVQTPETDSSTLNRKPTPTTDTVSAASELKLKKATKRKYKSALVSPEETKLDSTETKVKNKKLTNQESDSKIINLDFQDEMPNKHLKSATNSEHQSKIYAEERDESHTNDSVSVTPDNVGSKRVARKTVSKKKIINETKSGVLSDSEMASKIKDGDNISSTTASSKVSPQNQESAKKTEELSTKDLNSETLVKVDSKRTSRKRCSKNGSLKAAKKSVSKLVLCFKNNDEDRPISVETSSKISTSQNIELSKGTDELLMKDINTVIPTNVRSRKKFAKRDHENKSTEAVKKILSNSEQTATDNITPIENSADVLKNSPSQSKDCSAEDLIKDANTFISGNVDSKKRNRKRNTVTTKNDIGSGRVQASENSDKNHIISIEASSDNSPFQTKEGSKETEGLFTKDANTLISVNADLKRTSRKRGTGNKSSVTTKKDLISHSEQASKNNDIHRTISEENLSKNSPLPDSTKRTNSKNKTSSSKNTIPLSKHDSHIAVLDGRSDHKRKNFLHDSDELDSSNEMKESPVDQSQNSSPISLNVPKCNDNSQENLSSISKKANNLKKKISVPLKSRKKVNDESHEKDENQADASKNISESLDVVVENPSLSLKKSSSKKKVASSKIKVVTDSSKEHSDVQITELQVSSSYSNTGKKPKDQLKHSKSNNKSNQKEKVINSKKGKEIHSKQKSNSVESNVVSIINLSQNEVEKVNCNLIEESSMSLKLCKTKVNKSTRIGSTYKENSIMVSEQSILPEEATENKHLSEKFSEVQMESNSVEKPSMCYNSSISENSVDNEKAEKISGLFVDIRDGSESEKEKQDIIENMAVNLKTVDDYTVSSDTHFAETNFKSSVEFDEKMKKNYSSFCELKEILEASNISIEEYFKNVEMINDLNSIQPINTCFHKCQLYSKKGTQTIKRNDNIYYKLK